MQTWLVWPQYIQRIGLCNLGAVSALSHINITFKYQPLHSKTGFQNVLFQLKAET